MRLIFVVMAAMVGDGCRAYPACSAHTDCHVGEYCEPTYRVCVTDTHSDGDAGDRPGTDCTGCSAWETCQPPGNTCRPLTVHIASPTSGATFGEGASVRVTAVVTDWDGGTWTGASIPAYASSSVTAPAALNRNGELFTGDYLLPAGVGTHRLSAGWSNSTVKADVDVAAVPCEVKCAPYEECTATQDGGTCQKLELTLTWTSPDAGFKVGPADALDVGLELAARRADGGAFTGSVPFTMTGGDGGSGVLVSNGRSWTARLDAGTANGERRLWAGWDGGPQAQALKFEVVATAPTLKAYVQGPPARTTDETDSDSVNRWKKHEIAKVQIESDRRLQRISGADFNVPGVTSATDCERTCSPGNTCYCFGIDLAQQSLTQVTDKLYGTVPFELRAVADVYGNQSAPLGGTISVSRLKWERILSSSDTLRWLLTVAIARDGLIVSRGGTELVALRPDAGIAWTKSSTRESAIISAPVVGTRVYYGVLNQGGAQDPSWGALRKLRLDGTVDGALCSVDRHIYVGELALVNPGAADEGALAVREDGVLVSPNCSEAPLGLRPTAVPIAVVHGTDAYVSFEGSASVWKMSGVDATPADAGSVSTAPLGLANLFTVGTGLVGGGGSGPSVGGAVMFASAGTLLGTAVVTDVGARAGPAVVGGSAAAPTVYFGDETSHVWKTPVVPATPSFGNSGSSLKLGTSDFASHAPLLGRGGLVYVLGTDGVLRALDGSLAQLWSWNEIGNQTTSQLNLDLNRDAVDPCGPGQPGVLYVATTNAVSTKLYAVLVDSAGLDRSAPWPRYQHDPGNTGNAATSLAPWTCP